MTLQEVIATLSKHQIKLSVVDGQLKVRAAKGALTAELRQLLADNKQDLIDWISEKQRQKQATAPIPQRSAELANLPLSFAQQRLWLVDQLDPNNPAYNIPAAVRLTGNLDVTLLAKVFGEIVRRHEALRTSFNVSDGQAEQVIAAPADWPLAAEPAPMQMADMDEQAWLQHLAEQEAAKPFRLTEAPLLRTRLLQLDGRGQDHLLLLTVHHIISDGWSSGVILREVAALYDAFSQGQPSPLPELPIQYPDFAVWQRQWLSGEVLEQKLSYWRQQLASVPLLEMPTDRSRPAVQSYSGATLPIELDAELVNRIQGLAQAQGTTLFAALLAVFNALLQRWTRQDDICVGSPIANRNRPELEPLVGFFVNTLALRSDLSDNPSYEQLLERTKQMTLDAFQHQDVPFERIIDELGVARDLSHTPLFQVMFALQNVPSASDLPVAGLTLTPVERRGETAKFDITFNLREYRDASGNSLGVSGAIEYNTDLYNEATMRRFGRHFVTLLNGVAEQPQAPIKQLPLIDADDLAKIEQWNQRATDYPRSASVEQLFAQQAAACPEQVALLFGDQQLTYRQLDEQANQLANWLHSQGLQQGSKVGICLERSLEMVVATLAIVKAGAAYVPLDPNFPHERLQYMAADAAAPLVLVHQKLQQSLALFAPESVKVWESIQAELALQSTQAPTLEPVDSASQPIYVMYTSGTTGKPKGIEVNHRGVVRLVKNTDYVSIGHGDTLIQYAPTAFDASTFEIWGSLLNGGRLAICPPGQLTPAQLGEVLQQRQVSVLFITTALFNNIVEFLPDSLRSVQQLYFGGEVANPRLVERALRELPEVKIHHVYGPTENTTFSTWHPLTIDDCQRGNLPIGGPLANSTVYVVDEFMQPVPIGVPGELICGGDAVANGYLNLPERTAESFLDNPFHDDASAPRIYRSGDLVRWCDDGTIEFLGRIDQQVKVRGFRIELGEIEGALIEHELISELTLAVREDTPGDKRLVAYLVLTNGAELPATQDLRSFLAERLPEFMIPSAFVALDSLPMTPTGKVDKRALPAPEFGIDEESYVAPAGDTEVAVATVWADVLKLERVGAQDNFFNLGGHSLLATQVVSRLSDQFDLELSLRQLFEAPSVAGLAQLIETESSRRRVRLPAIEVADRREQLPLSYAQQRLWVVHQMDPASAAYNMPMALRIRGDLSVEALQKSLQALVDRHEVLRTRFAEENEQAYQLIDPVGSWLLPVQDLSQLDDAEREQQVLHLTRQEAAKPFDLSRGPVFRALLLKLADDQHVLLATMHHVVCDGWSMNIIMQEMAEFYRAFTSDSQVQLPELAVQYADYAVWQRQWQQGDALQQQLDFWCEQLRGAPELLHLPTDRPRPAVMQSQGQVYRFELPAELAQGLRDFSSARQLTPFMVAMAAFQVLLARYANQNDFCVGIPVAGRHRSEIQPLVGFFVNAIILRADLTRNPTVAELLEQIKERSLGAFAHQDTPAELVLEALNVRRHTSHTPLAQVGFNYHSDALEQAEQAAAQIADLTLEPLAQEAVAAKYDLILSLNESDSGLTGSVEFRSSLFDESTIAHMMQHFGTLLAGLMADEECLALQIPLLDEGELLQLLDLDREVFERVQPLTLMQRDLYMDALMNPDTLLNSLGSMLEVRGEFDPERWQQAWQIVIDKQPILRTHLVTCDAPYADIVYACVAQTGTDAAKGAMELVQLTPADADFERFYPTWVRTQVYKTYNLKSDPLMKNWVFQFADDHFYIMTSAHHLLLDGLSGTSVMVQACQCYEALGAGAEFKAVRHKFDDYITYNRANFDTSAVYETWQQLAAGAEPLDFPQQGLAPNSNEPVLKLLTRTIKQDHWQRLQAYCKDNKITPANYFKCLYALALRSYCRASDRFWIDEIVAGRPRGHMFNLGCYFQQVPVVFNDDHFTGDATLPELVQYSRQYRKQLGDQQSISNSLQYRLFPQGRLSYLFNFYTFPSTQPFNGHDCQVTHFFPEMDRAVNFITKIVDTDLLLTLQYPTQWFDDLRLLERLEFLSEQILDGTEKLTDLQLSLPDEAGQLLGASEALAHTDLMARIEQQVAATPSAVAVSCADQQLSYQGLNERANQLAHWLSSEGVGRGQVVAICTEPCVEQIVALLAVVKTGAAYLPVDANYPRERIAYMLGDAKVPVLLTQSHLLERLPELEVNLQCLDDVSAWAGQATDNPVVERQLQDPLYIIYTSGSTGQPKGAVVYQQGELNLLQWYQSAFEFGESDRTLVISAFGFDLTQKNLFVPLISGGELVLPSEPGYDDHAFVQLIKERAITRINCAPSAFYPLVENHRDGAALASLKTVFFGGEPIRMERLRHWVTDHQYQAEIVNMYGPTECTDISTFHRIANPLQYIGRSIPIGLPNPNVNLYVLDTDMRPVPDGVVGELYVGGLSVGAGYLDKPQLTAERFVNNPFGEGLIYRTGDLVRLVGDDGLEFVDRVDYQVKLRGLRIELEEVAYGLRQLDGAEDGVALVSNDRLVGYVTGNRGLTDSDWRAQLAKHLPDYMVPTALVVLDSWPLTPNGKIDRSALPEPEQLTGGYTAPRTPTEEKIASIWADVLKVEQISVHDSFFELGGHSLLATQAASRVREIFDVDVPLRVLFESPTVAAIAAAIDNAEQSNIPPVLPRAQLDDIDDSKLPLSYAQQRLWFLNQLQPDSAAYNMPLALILNGPLDLEALSQTFSEIVRRHEILRTCFPSVDGVACQQILPAEPLVIDADDWSQVAEAELDEHIQNKVAEFFKQPFDLQTGPLLRADAARLADRADADGVEQPRHLLLANMHHVVADGWSLGVLLNEVALLYPAFAAGQPAPLPELSVQYADYALWQQNWLSGDVYQSGMDYWREQLQGVSTLELPTDHQRPPIQNVQGASVKGWIDADVTGKLQAISQRQGATLFMTLLSAFNVLLSRYSNQTDICIGTPIANRTQAETEALIGCFVNTLALRNRVDGDQSFEALLEQVRQNTLAAYAHQHMPFEQIVDELGVARDMSHTPIFQVMFILQNAPLERDMSLPGFSVEAVGGDLEMAKFDLTLTVNEMVVDGANQLHLALQYQTALFDEETVARLLANLQFLLTNIAEHPELEVHGLPIIAEPERQRLLQDWNATPVGGDVEQTWLDLFGEQVQNQPDACAIVDGEQRHSYADLQQRAQQLASHLQQQGVASGDLVAVCLPRNADLIASLLAVHLAGAAYVPLDPNYPRDRLRYMLEDSGAKVLLSEAGLSERQGLAELVPDTCPIVCIDQLADIAIAELPGASADAMAYVIYTSGSTGMPKGVALEHRNASSLVFWAKGWYREEELDGVLFSTSVCFDLSIYELFCTLALGGKVIVAENALALPDLPAKDEVVLINTVPSAIAALAAINGVPTGVKVINLAGEALKQSLVEELYGLGHVDKVYDLYGPTEDTVYSTASHRQVGGRASIGRPVPGTQAYVLDELHQPVPQGAVGELWLAGAGVAREYLNRPELTEEKFVRNPFAEPTVEASAASRMYGTGDLVRYLNDGRLEYLGRIDHQVKVRGFRIELGEIEAVLNRHPQVHESVVHAVTDEAGAQALVGYVVVTEQAPQNAELKLYLKTQLPDYMVPSAFVVLDELPLTPNGKVDRKALPLPDQEQLRAVEYVAPRNDMEQQLADIWAEVLHRDPVGVLDNFFDIGGNSLLAVQVVSRVRESFSVEIPLSALFEVSTVEGMANYIETTQWAREDVAAEDDGDREEFEL